jgi:peptidoglycan hydrolase-like protein with peptidoglycan-binding domain
VKARRRAATGVAGVAVLAAATAATVTATTGENAEAGSGTTASATSTGTATVERRDLVERETVDGTLGYADSWHLTGTGTGTITNLPAEGAVVARGQSLYSVNGEPARWVFYGELPAWRDFASGMADGEDVRQLENNLRKLGYDPDRDMDVDDDWDSATTAAVKRFQEDHGLTEDGSLGMAELVFTLGPVRVGDVSVQRGAAPQGQLMTLTGTRRQVTVELDADRQGLVSEGAEVSVDLPNGDTAAGRITDVGDVARDVGSEDRPQMIVDVEIELTGKAASGTGFDQAPVDVGLEAARADDVLVVPVGALLARGDGYVVEVLVSGGRRSVAVEPGLYSDDLVEVSGTGLAEGMKVVVAE